MVALICGNKASSLEVRLSVAHEMLRLPTGVMKTAGSFSKVFGTFRMLKYAEK